MKEEKTLVFFVDDKAKITKAGKDIPFAELKEGAHVSVKCRRHGDKMIALRIQVLTDGAK